MDIEEDLKILQEFTELDRKLRNYKVESDYDNFCERRCVAIDHILAEREEDKKKIYELIVDNRKLQILRIENDYGYENIHFFTENKLISIDTNKYLIEIENGKFVDIKQVYLDNKNSISRQKIEDDLDKIIEKFENIKTIEAKQIGKSHMSIDGTIYLIKKIKERLLEEE